MALKSARHLKRGLLPAHQGQVGLVPLDGTEIKANAALDANHTYEYIEEEVTKMLTEMVAMDAEEDKLYGDDKRGDELHEELRALRSRPKRLLEYVNGGWDRN